MKIVYYLPSLVVSGGIERIITFKANYFVEHFENYDITIITSEQMGEKPYFALSPKVKHIDIDVPIDRPYSQSKLKKYLAYPYRYYLFKRRLSKTLNMLSADIFISTMRRELNFINDLKDGSIKIGEFHVTRFVYGSEAIHSGNLIARRIKNYLANRFVTNLSRLRKVVILTHEGSLEWPELHNIEVIPNPIPTLVINKRSNCSGKKVIAVGRYTPQKGFDILISAWKKVTERYPDWSLNIYGEGELKESYQKQIDELKLNGSCFLKEPVKNIYDKYIESSIFVLSSHDEGFGMVIIEAMSCGLPVVSFSCPCGPKEMIENGINGILVKNGDGEELANQICCLIEKPELRKKIAEQAYIYSRKYYMENIAGRWKSLFETIIKNN